jgi:hypothetical protein
MRLVYTPSKVPATHNGTTEIYITGGYKSHAEAIRRNMAKFAVHGKRAPFGSYALYTDDGILLNTEQIVLW